MADGVGTDTADTPEKEPWMGTFIGALREGVSVSSAARRAGVCRKTVYRYRDQQDDFRKSWDDAVEDGTDRLEDEALRRAMEGTDKPVYQGGVNVGTIREYSDTLAIFLLKARRPEKFRDNVDIKHSGRVQLDFTDIVKRSAEAVIEPLEPTI